MIIHCVDDFDGAGDSDKLRIERAKASWPKEVLRCVLHLGRGFGDKNLRYVKDILDLGLSVSGDDGDLLLLTNADSGFAVDWERWVSNVVGGAYSHRVNYNKPVRVAPSVAQMLPRGVNSGIDLIALRAGFWRAYRSSYPDLVMGRNGWDWIFKFSLPEVIPPVIWHELHGVPDWRIEDEDSANIHNRRLCLDWVNAQSLELQIRIRTSWPLLAQYEFQVQCVDWKAQCVKS